MNMRVKHPPRNRSYHAPRRTAAAAETRQAVLRAAQEEFEERGWAATTMRSIATRAGVSPKTVEALFATKPALLEATLLAVLRGDAADTDTGDVFQPEALLQLLPEARREIFAAPDAATMLELMAATVSEVNARFARIHWALEAAVSCDERLAEIWARLTAAVRVSIRTGAEVLLQKPGVRSDLTHREAEEALLIGNDWNTYRTLAATLGMTPVEFRAWLDRYFRRLLLE